MHLLWRHVPRHPRKLIRKMTRTRLRRKRTGTRLTWPLGSRRTSRIGWARWSGMKEKEGELIVSGWTRTRPHKINTEQLRSWSIESDINLGTKVWLNLQTQNCLSSKEWALSESGNTGPGASTSQKGSTYTFLDKSHVQNSEYLNLLAKVLFSFSILWSVYDVNVKEQVFSLCSVLIYALLIYFLFSSFKIQLEYSHIF